MNISTEKSPELDDFLRRELADVDLRDVQMEPCVVPYWRWGFQSRFRLIANCGSDAPGLRCRTTRAGSSQTCS